jgi:hypothetical protein
MGGWVGGCGVMCCRDCVLTCVPHSGCVCACGCTTLVMCLQSHPALAPSDSNATSASALIVEQQRPRTSANISDHKGPARQGAGRSRSAKTHSVGRVPETSNLADELAAVLADTDDEDGGLAGLGEESPPLGADGSVVTIHVRGTHGDTHFVGLTSLVLLDRSGQPLPVGPEHLSAYPRDINDVPGHVGDTRTLDKIVNGVHVTTDDQHMWLCPYLPPVDAQDGTDELIPQQWLAVELPEPVHLGGLRLYNYNKNAEDTVRGIRLIDVYVDDVRVSPVSGFIVRKAPGNTHYDFGQTFLFDVPWAQAQEPNLSLGVLDRQYRAQMARWAQQQRQLSPAYVLIGTVCVCVCVCVCVYVRVCVCSVV